MSNYHKLKDADEPGELPDPLHEALGLESARRQHMKELAVWH